MAFFTQVSPQFLLIEATRELCLTALLQLDKRELLHFTQSIIDGAVCLGGISTSHFTVASLQVQHAVGK